MLRSGPPEILQHVFRRLWHRRKLCFAVAGAMLAICVVGIVAIPRKYQSNLKVLVKNERVNAPVSQDGQTQGVFYIDEVGEARINTEIELLSSRDLLRAVVRRCHLAAAEGRRGTETEREDLAIGHLQKSLSVLPVRKSTVIGVSYRSSDARQSAEVLRALMDLYLDSHLRVHGAPGTVSFFEHLAEKYDTERQAAEGQLAELKTRLGVGSLKDERAMRLQRIEDLQTRRGESAAAAARSDKQRSRLLEFVSSTPATTEKERRDIPNQYAIQQLTTVLVGLENRLPEVTSRYREDDRVVRDLNAQIQQTKDALAEARQTRSEEVATEANPLHRAAETDYIRTEAEHAGAVSQEQELSRELHAEQARLRLLDGEAAKYDEISRHVSQLIDMTESYRKKGYEAEVGDLLDKQRIANIAVIEEPSQPLLPVSPRRGILLFLGVVWSAMAGLGAAIMVELCARRVRSPFELEQALDAPVLAAFDPGSLPPRYGSTVAALYHSLQYGREQRSWRLT